MKRWTFKLRNWLFWPPVMLGAIALYFASQVESHMGRKPVQELARTMRVISAPQTAFVPRAVGYGVARSDKVWRAVSEVSGKVVHVHPDLNEGIVVRMGTRLIGIDKTEYQLKLAQLNADLNRFRNELAELDLRESSLKTELDIETDSLEIADEEVERLRQLVESRAASKSEFDAARRTQLRQSSIARTKKHELDLIPSHRKTLQATIEAQQARVKDAENLLEKTDLTAPFDCRLRDVEIQTGQFLGTGEQLFEADGVHVTEVMAQVAVDRAATLLDPASSKVDRIMSLFAGQDTTNIRELLPVSATVRASAGDLSATWDARLVNVSSEIAPRTRTVGLVVAVDEPYESAIPGVRPPLVRGIFCEVEFRGPNRTNQIVVPRIAVEEDHVYVVNDQQRLERRRVEVAMNQSSLAVIESGLSPGERVVVSDATPAIVGQLVDPIEDRDLLDKLLMQARGEEPLR